MGLPQGGSSSSPPSLSPSCVGSDLSWTISASSVHLSRGSLWITLLCLTASPFLCSTHTYMRHTYTCMYTHRHTHTHAQNSSESYPSAPSPTAPFRFLPSTFLKQLRWVPRVLQRSSLGALMWTQQLPLPSQPPQLPGNAFFSLPSWPHSHLAFLTLFGHFSVLDLPTLCA